MIFPRLEYFNVQRCRIVRLVDAIVRFARVMSSNEEVNNYAPKKRIKVEVEKKTHLR